MLINGLEAQPHQLSYDKILKNTLAQSSEMTVRFINGLLGDNIPLDARVEWLDKESVNDKYVGFIADFYPRVAGRMYSIEIEHDDKGDMAFRVFMYSIGGATLHSMAADNANLNITFPQPCVVFLRSRKDTPQKLTWGMKFFDGQKITLEVPVIRLADLSVKEIAERDLLPIGQFYLRSFEPLTAGNVGKLTEAAASLLTELKAAVEQEAVPYSIGVQMQDTIRKTLENVVIKSDLEVDITMTTNIVETLPWIDYQEVFEKFKAEGWAEGIAEGITKGIAEGIAKGKAEGIAEGKAEGKAEGRTEFSAEIASKMFARQNQGMSQTVIIQTLRDFGIPEKTIQDARKQHDAERAANAQAKAKKRPGPDL